MGHPATSRWRRRRPRLDGHSSSCDWYDGDGSHSRCDRYDGDGSRSRCDRDTMVTAAAVTTPTRTPTRMHACPRGHLRARVMMSTAAAATAMQ
jgi:hypothetical protein